MIIAIPLFQLFVMEARGDEANKQKNQTITLDRTQSPSTILGPDSWQYVRSQTPYSKY